MANDRVIFLDFDGVINDNVKPVTKEAMSAFLFLLHLYPSKVVVTTSNLQNGTIEKQKYLSTFLNKFGIYDIDFINPNFRDGVFFDKKLSFRALGIIDYFSNHEVGEYLILDDDYYNEYKRLGLNYYKTMACKGLRWNDLKKITFSSNIPKIDIKYHLRPMGMMEVAHYQLIKTLKNGIEKSMFG